MDPRRRRRLLVFGLSLLAAAACERSTPTRERDVCPLLDASEASAVLAGRASVGRPEHLGSQPFEVDRCRWSAGDRALALLASRSPDGDAAAAHKAFENVRANAVREGVDVVDVPGLGDSAWWESDRLANQLHVLSGAVSLTFTTRSPASASPPRELLVAAGAALGRLTRPGKSTDR
ncbi:MAG: hypothetical protein ACKO2K_19405 [Alphaproteobacteria bacterium]